MEKLIAILLKVSYWLGVLCLFLAVLSKVLNSLGTDLGEFMTRGNNIGYHSFIIGAILFLLMAIATGILELANRNS